MTSRSAIIISFLLATLLAAGAVELFYRALGKAMTEDSEVSQGQPEKKLGPNFRSPTSLQAGQRKAANKREDYTIISKRNLFGKAEKATAVKTVTPQPVLTTTSLDLTLLGTVGGKANDQRAIIRDKKKNTQDIYYRGDVIANALIKEISRGKIILTLNGKDEVLLMEESKSPPGSVNKQRFSMPDIITPPERRIAEDDTELDDTIDEDLEMEGDGPSDDIPPPPIPRRIMKPKPKTHR